MSETQKSDQSIDLAFELKRAVQSGIADAVKSRFNNSYNNPLDKVLEKLVGGHESGIRDMLNEAIRGCISDVEFRNQIVTATRSIMAKTLVQRFGGEIEKTINALKSDPMTRAKITLAIEEIVANHKKQ